MDTNRIKRFATEARNILKAGIAAKILSLGFDQNGNVPEENMPQLMQGGSVWNGQLQTEGFYHQWMALYNRIQQIGIKDVYEEAAYTWFNRLCAIRILQKNNLCSPVLAYADAARTPIIVDEARQGRVPQMKEEMRQRLAELLDDDTKVTEQFAILITAWCHDNPIIQQCFGGIADYTELLLPNNILAEGGFVDLLNHTEFITDDDFHSPELIGWLYQFYISERKDEVFAKKGKFEADEIPAATQIFTPNWIVKYMVQNTVGRIYLDNNPYETQLQKKWQYLVEPTEKPSKDAVLKYDELTDLKVADLACGSGHILNECFDLLYDLYIAEGYSRTEAIENIFNNNLTGIDLDTRAKQLATFALLLKACQKDSSFADAHVLPNVLSIPVCDRYTLREPLGHFVCACQLDWHQVDKAELENAFDLMKDADSLGSIMRFEISQNTRDHLVEAVKAFEAEPRYTEDFKSMIDGFRLILALTDKYHALVMNPPYMGGGNMNGVLSKYVKDNYKDGKADLMTVFMLLAKDRTMENGKYGMINLPSWLFLSTFETLRKQIVNDFHIDSLLHMGRGIFGIDWGSTAFVISKTKSNVSGVYFRLHKRNFQHIYYYHIEEIFLKALNDHAFKYDFDSYRDEDVVSQEISLNSSENGLQLYYVANQKNFEKIPGAPIGYWVSEKIFETFTRNRALSAVCKPTQGLATADNARFLRLWFEVGYNRIGFGCENAASAACSQKKWFPTTKGGGFRRWFGNMSYVVNWENDGEELTNFKGSVIRNRWRYFTKCGSTWSTIASGKPSFRYFDRSWLFETKGSVCFPENEEDNNMIMGYLNSSLITSFLQVLSPTLDYHEGPMGRIPYKEIGKDEKIENLVQDNISLSKQDWDSHETSWDFERNPLIEQHLDIVLAEMQEQGTMPEDATVDDIGQFHLPGLMQPLEVLVENYKAEWEDHFMQLHQNEEELNRQFISIYGLEDELTPDVPLNEITILQQGEISIE